MTASAARKSKPGHALPRVIGHRGACGLAPENTVASFRKAADLGVRWVEFDVHLSSDGVPIVIHDDTVNRTTSGRGKVAALMLAELQTLDAGTWFEPRFQNERVPTLETIVALLGRLGVGAVVEIKPSPGAEEATAEATVRLLMQRWPDHLPPPMVSSFEVPALERAHEVAPGIARALLVERVRGNWQSEVDRLGCSALHADQSRLDQKTIASVTKAGLPLFAYTVNDAARAAALFEWGVAAVFTDRPDLIEPVARTASL
ncbi:MAG TPA: glycerophosphodiester phosphodiesterase [Stellaceae bacterium]|nr:glycerophosphodiester phosphodiesterase [Stellaceae bacterium]